MKSWQNILLGIFVGIILSSAIYLIASPPRGTTVELLPAPTAGPLMIHVDGSVQQPGVYPLSRGSRVQDALLAAGGMTGEANTAAVNLAAPLRDGEKLHIPAQGTPFAPRAPAYEEETAQPNLVGPVNLNSASLEALENLPGIGPTRASQIIAYREQNGGFQSIEEIMEVSGIGPASFERLKDWITVSDAQP
jgi:competence protein ComEA